MTLDEYYKISQILLVVVAIIAAGFAYLQITTFKRFELLKLLAEPRVANARRLIYKVYYENKACGEEWWQEDKANEAAAIVCSSFDIVGVVGTGLNRRFFARHWWYSICNTHDALRGYLKERRLSAPKIYEGYESLFESAVKHDDRPQSARRTSN